MKKYFTLAFMVLLSSATAFAGILFQDDFNDGNADGWLSVVRDSRCLPNCPAWNVQDGMLLYNNEYDHHAMLVENLNLSIQTIEVKVKLTSTAGYGGITVWYADANNWIDIYLYPNANSIGIYYCVNGSITLQNLTFSSSYNSCIW